MMTSTLEKIMDEELEKLADISKRRGLSLGEQIRFAMYKEQAHELLKRQAERPVFPNLPDYLKKGVGVEGEWLDDSNKTTEDEMEDAARYLEGRWATEETAHPVKIETQDHGVAVQVGCKTFAFTTVDEALKYVRMYLESPEETVKLFTEGKLFGKKKGK